MCFTGIRSEQRVHGAGRREGLSRCGRADREGDVVLGMFLDVLRCLGVRPAQVRPAG